VVYNHAETFFLENYKKHTLAEMSRIYRKDDGTKVIFNYFNRISHQLNKYGQTDTSIFTATDWERKAVDDGLDMIKNTNVKRYSEELGKEYGLSWDTIRKQVNAMIRYGIIK